MFEKTIAKLEKELAELNRQLKVDIPKMLNEAAALGDLSENAEYDAAREKKKNTESRVSQLKGRIRDLNSIDLSKVSRDSVGLGSKVSLEDLDTGAKITYELVLADQVDIDKGRISLQAPVGRALMGKRVDDEAVVMLPGGKKEYLITKLITLHERTDLE